MKTKHVLCAFVCKKTGHLADTCFLVIGHPEWWEDRSHGRGGGRGMGRRRGIGVRANVVVARE